MTHNYVILKISPSSYAEIANKLSEAEYGHAFRETSEWGIVLDMQGIALALAEERDMASSASGPSQQAGVSEADLVRRFTYHPPKETQPQRYDQLRAEAKGFAEMIVQLTPYSREQSLALTKLEEAVMWANAAIARNE